MASILRKIDDSGRVLLNEEIRKDFPLEKGQDVNLELDKEGNKVIITYVENV